jgi:MFS transporter, MHS family, shikimate and dehydroshikimate transport protein
VNNDKKSKGEKMAETSSVAGGIVVSPNRLRHVMMAAAVGSALEWYDFFIYGTASALVFGDLFFPKFDADIGTLAAYATFAVGFIARPFGGLFFGHFGDRIGRSRCWLQPSCWSAAAPS